jgi:hypothetical protein
VNQRLRALLLVVSGVLALADASPAARTRMDLDVRREGDRWHIQATLFAPVPHAIAWDVLTDFERMEMFVPNLRHSRVVSQDGARVRIAQHGVARFGPLAFGFDSERLVELSPPHEIRSLQTRGNMRHLESVTRFVARDGGTELVYRVEVEPGAFFPAALTERFLVHEVQEQFAAIVEEMERRQRLRDVERSPVQPP